MTAIQPVDGLSKSDAVAHSPLLSVKDVTLQYKTREHIVTATYRVSFDVFQADRFVLLGPSVFHGAGRRHHEAQRSHDRSAQP